jgi:hypothetical protein
VWKQCLEAVSDPEGPHFHAGMAAMAEYAQYSFDLQHNTVSHPVLRPKPDAHHMNAQDQVVIHMARM